MESNVCRLGSGGISFVRSNYEKTASKVIFACVLVICLLLSFTTSILYVVGNSRAESQVTGEKIRLETIIDEIKLGEDKSSYDDVGITTFRNTCIIAFQTTKRYHQYVYSLNKDCYELIYTSNSVAFTLTLFAFTYIMSIAGCIAMAAVVLFAQLIIQGTKRMFKEGRQKLNKLRMEYAQYKKEQR